MSNYSGHSYQVVKQRLPRAMRRLIFDVERCRYRREEFATADARNTRYRQLRGSVRGLVKYSDSGATGGLVYVVAWSREEGRGMTGANGETGGRPPASHAPGKVADFGVETVSMEL